MDPLTRKLYHVKREQEGAGLEELVGLWREREDLMDRRLERYMQLYGLHAARQRYLEYHLSTSSTPTSEADILRATEIWPLLFPHPPSASACTLCRCKLYPSSFFDALRFKLPDFVTNESRALSLDLFGEDLNDPKSDLLCPRDADAEEAEKAGGSGVSGKVKRA
ncbi:hypothetical protein JCM10213v2_008572 [Rhodosporidiobolus nylandii]